MHLPEIDRYARLESPVHSWDPRLKILALLLLIFAIVLQKTLSGALIGLVIALLLLLLSRIPLRFAQVHLRWPFLMLAAVFAVLAATVPGAPPFSRGAFAFASLVSLRAAASIVVLFVAGSTARLEKTLKALQCLRVPAVVVGLLLFTYRYIFVLLDDLRRMLQAAHGRGYGGGLRWRSLRALGGILSMLFVRSFERTDRLRWAMAARGYDGRIRTLEDFHARGSDVLKAIVVALAAAGLAVGGGIA